MHHPGRDTHLLIEIPGEQAGFCADVQHRVRSSFLRPEPESQDLQQQPRSTAVKNAVVHVGSDSPDADSWGCLPCYRNWDACVRGGR